MVFYDEKVTEVNDRIRAELIDGGAAARPGLAVAPNAFGQRYEWGNPPTKTVQAATDPKASAMCNGFRKMRDRAGLENRMGLRRRDFAPQKYPEAGRLWGEDEKDFARDAVRGRMYSYGCPSTAAAGL